TRVRTLWAGDVDLADAARAEPRLRPTQRYALVEARPETGRLHQVRRHLKTLGHPVIGDANYGRGEHNRAVAGRVGLGRLALHARSIAFDAAGARHSVTSAVPAELAAAMAAMGAPAELLAALTRSGA
ncbi:MAG TPA: hypothetical protein VHB21_09185, partial [Minicystis sp.]|nr:hypothetical protein [Minicystis sp.]